MQNPHQDNTESSRSVVLLLGSVALIAVTTAYFCLPAMKGTNTKKGTNPPVVMNPDLLPKKKPVKIRTKKVSLIGIFYTKENPLAVVDGEMVREGDVINGVKVIKIHQSKVEFEFSGHRWIQEI